MLIQLLPLLLAQAAPMITTTTIESHSGPIGTPAKGAVFENIGIAVSSPQGPLWEGTLRVSPNQGASYQQNLSQASAQPCPSGSPYERSERSHLNVSVYAEQNLQLNLSYRIDASWARPIANLDCRETGTRTVQINHVVVIAPGETSVVEGDAGLRVQLTRGR